MARHVLVALLLAVLGTACQSTAEISNDERHSATHPSNTQQSNSRTTAAEDDSLVDDNPFADAINGGGIDFRLTHANVNCSARNLNVYPDTPFLVAHYVVDGNLGAPCFGEPDERLVEAWQILTMITPPGQLHELNIFAGFVSQETHQTTLAFVNTLVDDPAHYQMSVNLDQAGNNPDELSLTMAHEFAHVLTSTPSQIDRTVYPSDCRTWHNARGCYREDSLMWAWVQEFWDDGLIGGVDPRQEPTRDSGAARCAINDGFLGPYSASHPEEDFAESFSAFVFRIDVDTPELWAKMEWFAARPELVDFRNRSVEAGFKPLRNIFDGCA